MFKEETAELILGAIVVAVAVFFFAFAGRQASGGEGSAGAYALTAQFGRIDGLNVGSDVRVSGVKVGVVKDVALNPDDYRARVTLAINRGVEVLDDATAKVAADGLLGGAYISIEQNGVAPLPAGSEIVNTQGSVDLLTLFASFAAGSGGDDAGGAEQQSEEAAQ